MNYVSPALSRRLSENAEIQDHRDLTDAMRGQDIEQAYEVMERHSQESLRQKLVGLAEIRGRVARPTHPGSSPRVRRCGAGTLMR